MPRWFVALLVPILGCAPVTLFHDRWIRPAPHVVPEVQVPTTTTVPATTTTVHVPHVPHVAPRRPRSQPQRYTCTQAFAYLATHSAPGFGYVCPGWAEGHQAMTCINLPGVCPDEKLIIIAVVCPASVANEANNSWVLTGLRAGSIDPYGDCPG